MLFVGPRDLIVYGNESQLVTAVTNLVENAVAYSPEYTRVTVTTHLTSHSVEISVVDPPVRS